MGKVNQTYQAINNRIVLLKEYWEKFGATNIRIETTATDQERTTLPYFKDDIYNQTESAYLTALDFLTSALATLSELPPSVDDDGTTSGKDQDEAAPMKPPKVELPKFSGDYTEWEGFHDLFIALVDKNKSLSDVQKLYYLKTSLEGEAAFVLKNIATSKANYKPAWEKLKNRFTNERSLVKAHLKMLFDSPPIGVNVLTDLKSLRDRSNAALLALKNLGRKVKYWDDILVFHFLKKLDKQSKQEWEFRLGEELQFPSFAQWNSFVDIRIRSLEEFEDSTIQANKPVKSKQSQNVKAHLNARDSKCITCGANHALYQCDEFRSKSVDQRLALTRSHQHCFNCLRSGHFPSNCSSKRVCLKCQGKHHTLLHSDRRPNQGQSVSTNRESVNGNDFRLSRNSNSLAPTNDTLVPSINSNSSVQTPNVQTHLGSTRTHSKQILLATAWIKISSHAGRSVQVRALIDPGSEATFVSENVAQVLRVSRQRTHTTVSGIGANRTATVNSAANLLIESCHETGPVITIQALILKRLTAYQVSPTANQDRWTHWQNMQWADPFISRHAPIELIIGADYYSSILLTGVRKGEQGALIAQNTIFGWVLTGPIQPSNEHVTHLHALHAEVHNEINEILHKFWEVEATPQINFLSEEDKKCEEHFVKTHSRESDGKYVVRLPINTESPIDIGFTHNIAVKSFYNLEKRLKNNPVQASSYHGFLQEYLDLNHMREESAIDSQSTQNVFLSHHPVIRHDSKTTRLRVVFNASMRTSNGSTLNDFLFVGPKLQADIVAIILKWRKSRFVFAADIAKMFRQIWVDPRDTHFQLIVWRSDPNHSLKNYALRTVTYGTASAPYLANRVIKQLAIDEGTNFPLATPVLNEQIYVDDVLFGADDRILALQLRHQVTELLSRGGFHLRKWSSNCPRLLADISDQEHELASSRPFQEIEGVKMLGLFWVPSKDEFQFQFKVHFHSDQTDTKRTVLSTIARMFDPLGWISPVIITAKIFMQKLWSAKLNWDDPLPVDLQQSWNIYSAELKELPLMTIPRWIGLGTSTLNYEIHGFADASQHAYAAVIFLRVVTIPEQTSLHLLIAKTKVAPLKPLTIPRLELLAAVIMVRLIEYVQVTLKFINCPVYCWTDSAVALAWIHKHPSRLKTFTAHRVAEIQGRVPNATWRHVPSEFNPADCASRGLTVSQLSTHQLWWCGPSWLIKPPNEWPNLMPSPPNEVKEEIKISLEALHAQTHVEWDLPTRVSSWVKLLRVTAYIFRFVSRCQAKDTVFLDYVINAREINEARKFWIKYVQSLHFQEEIKVLTKCKSLPKSSPLLRLNPFLDTDAIVRVGGRLRHSELSYSQRFPIVLPNHRISELIIADCHQNILHGGTQLTLSIVRQVFWIINSRRIVRRLIHKCVKCVRARATTAQQQMGDLPKVRVTPSRPFSHCGLDYAGPLQARVLSGRGYKSHKVYIALFICLATRAIHLELVLDYSTAAFLSAFDRFVSRRSLPSEMYSDNGTNFQGADKELSVAFQQVISDPALRSRLAGDSINWHFIPPAAPHFGGIWEAGVKSVKTHLKLILAAHTPSIEELNTLLCKIEACLNSRPLAPLSDDLESCEALTPGHFLVGGPIKSVPTPSVLDLNENRLSRWQTIHKMHEQFWKIWSNEYLRNLQTRTKWHSQAPNLQIGDLVLLKSATLPPAKWELGRVTKCHPGKDGLTRVVTVKTAHSQYVRSVTNLCKLPVS
ncbi:uncharacterized protein LOC143208476 [Lasioglossum baleicum]|uniref:uncharacterized protein LOC143208476 n=1 Tax=Lasioglossum baleicum TaxID=434251 RepID=UPI003FCE1A8E